MRVVAATSSGVVGVKDLHSDSVKYRAESARKGPTQRGMTVDAHLLMAESVS